MKKSAFILFFLVSTSYASVDKVTIYNSLAQVTDSETVNGEKLIPLPPSYIFSSLQGSGNIE